MRRFVCTLPIDEAWEEFVVAARTYGGAHLDNDMRKGASPHIGDVPLCWQSFDTKDERSNHIGIHHFKYISRKDNVCHRFVQPATAAEISKLRRGETNTTDERQVNPGSSAFMVVTMDNELRQVKGKYGFAKDGSFYNARYETVGAIPTWSDSFRNRRCVIPTVAVFEGPYRDPHPFVGVEDKLMYMTAIYQVVDGVKHFAVLTCTSPPVVARVHPRSPVFVPQDQIKSWTDPDKTFTTNDLIEWAIHPPKLTESPEYLQGELALL